MLYDFVVSGAGPAGSQLAWRLSEKGYKVLILEEHDVIGRPVACSGHVSTKIWNLIPQNKSIIENKIKAGILHLNDRSYELRQKKIVSYVLCREKLDQYVHSLATDAGAQTLFGARVVDAKQRPGGVEISVRLNGKIGTVKTKMLAGCDGPASVVRKSVGLPEPKFLHGIFCYADEHDTSDAVELWFDVPGFFSWKIPRGESVEYGLGVGPKDSCRAYFEVFLKRLNVKPAKLHAGLIPHGLLSRVSKHRTFLCGDAASQVKPFTGGGIVYGMTCAKIAAETIDPDRPETLELYERAWRNELGGEIRMGAFIKSVYSTPLFEPMVWMMSKMDVEKMHMDMPSTIVGGKRI